jgi:hypothetical protein
MFAHIRDRLLTGGFAANPIGVGGVGFSTTSKKRKHPTQSTFDGKR